MFVGYFFPAKKKSAGGILLKDFKLVISKPTETGLPLTAQEQ